MGRVLNLGKRRRLQKVCFGRRVSKGPKVKWGPKSKLVISRSWEEIRDSRRDKFFARLWSVLLGAGFAFAVLGICCRRLFAVLLFLLFQKSARQQRGLRRREAANNQDVMPVLWLNLILLQFFLSLYKFCKMFHKRRVWMRCFRLSFEINYGLQPQSYIVNS